MGWGGSRPGSGPKRRKSNSAPQRAEPKLKPAQAPSETLPAEIKTAAPAAFDPRALAMMLPEIEEISRRYSTKQQRTRENSPFKLPTFPKAVLDGLAARKLPTMAMDDALTGNLGFADNGWLSGPALDALPGEGLLFLGYTYLAELAQRPEFRVMSETIADDATREWIDFDVVGDEKQQAEEKAKDPEGFEERLADPDERKKRVDKAGKTDKVKALQDDQLRLQVKENFYEQCRNDGFFGRSHLFLDIRTNDSDDINPEELKSPIGDSRDAMSKAKVPVGSFKALRTIEPVWTYPLMYNAINPLREDWYNPQVWFVMGQEIHGSRIQTFIGHPVPDMLKPAYAFGGLSLTQLAKPYVDIWLQTRDSVAALIHSFSVMVLMTDMQTILAPGSAAGLMARVALFNALRDNQGAFVVNKQTEDFKNVSASLAGLHELQSQSQEHMASVHRIPLVKFTGIQPAGLNASSEGEIQVYDDTIAAYQSRFEDPNLRRVINFQQLSLWGEIDPEITHRWNPLREITQAEKGQKEKDDADRNQKYVDMGALAPGEVRAIIIEDPDLPYTGLDPDDVPEPPAEEGMIGPGAGGAAAEFEKEEDPGGGKGPDAGPAAGADSADGGGASDAADPFGATDAGWKEGDHPRAPDGKFGAGSVSAYVGHHDPKASGGGVAGSLNAALRKGGKISPKAQKIVQDMDRLFAKLKPTSKPMTLFRGAGSDVYGKAPKDAGFVSTSPDKGVADSIGESNADDPDEAVTYEIKIPAGARVLRMNDFLDADHEFADEQEHLLPRNSEFDRGKPRKDSDGRTIIPLVYKLPKKIAQDAVEWEEGKHPRAPDGKFGSGGGSSGGPKAGQKLQMPQFGLTPTPWQSHQPSSFKLPPRKPMPKSEGKPAAPGSLVAFVPGDDHGVKKLNGVAFESWKPPSDWADVEGQAEIDEPEMPDLPKGMTMSTGVVIREKDGRVWVMRPSKGFGGYDQTFPKGGLEDGLSGQANAIKEAYEETGLKVKITGFAGDHEGDTTVSRFYFAERTGGDPADAGWEAEGVILAPVEKLDGILNRKRDKTIAAALAPAAKPKLDPKDLKKIGGKMGSNEGGTFEDASGSKFYIKRPQSKDHVKNEMAAARLYQLAGVNTLNYREVEGGNHVATDLMKLDKNNISQLTPAERAEATKDFAVHAWLSNYDAAGTGGDNQGVLNGKLTTLDVGGSLRYRAQGAPKGAAFGNKVLEIDSMRDPTKNYDASKLFGKMSDDDIKASAERVTSIPDAAIRAAVGDDSELADTLVARKKNLADRFKIMAADEGQFEESKHPRAPDGKFASGAGSGSTGAAKFAAMSTSDFILSSPKGGSHYRTAIANLLKKGGLAPEQIKQLKLQLAASWVISGKHYAAKGDTKEVNKIAQKIKDLGGDPNAVYVGSIGKPPAAKPAPQKVEIKQAAPPPPAAKAKHGPATEAELAKAKKGVALQIQYVPGAPADNPKAQALVAEFNKKWEGKEGLGPEALQAKVDDFKDLAAAMKPLQGEAQKAAAEQAEKAAATAKAAAADKAAKAAVQAKEAAAKNKVFMDSLGISEQQAAGVAELASMLGKSNADLIESFKKYEDQASKLGYPITGFQCALIKNYSDGGYGAINKALRSGSWTPAQHAYVAMVNKALMGMPKYTGPGLTRNTKLSKEQQASYVQGNIKQEEAFMSTSTGSVFSGNTTFKVTAIGKRGASIKKLSNHPHEDEVLFAAKTYFKVTKTEGNPGGPMTIHLEEWEEHV